MIPSRATALTHVRRPIPKNWRVTWHLRPGSKHTQRTQDTPFQQLFMTVDHTLGSALLTEASALLWMGIAFIVLRAFQTLNAIRDVSRTSRTAEAVTPTCISFPFLNPLFAEDPALGAMANE